MVNDWDWGSEHKILKKISEMLEFDGEYLPDHLQRKLSAKKLQKFSFKIFHRKTYFK